MTRKFLRLSIIALPFVAPTWAVALGMGPIQVNSALNQSLSAEIELQSVDQATLDRLNIRVASQAFDRSRFSRSADDSKFSAALQSRDGRHYIKLTSNAPIREPLLNLLVELDWDNGRVVREFAVLLDPPGFARSNPPAPARVAEPAPAPRTRPADPAPAAAPAAVAAATPTPAPAEPLPENAFRGGDNYGPVGRGETLWRIADQTRPENVSIQQMMLALRDANPRAFLRNNIDGLRAGSVLRVPSAEEIARYTELEARELVRRSQQRLPAASVAAVQAAPASTRTTGAGSETLARPRVELAVPDADTGPVATNTASSSAPAVPAFDARYRISLAGGNVKLQLAQLSDLRQRVDRLVAEGDLQPLTVADNTFPAESVRLSAQPELAESAEQPVTPVLNPDPTPEVGAVTPVEPLPVEQPPVEQPLAVNEPPVEPPPVEQPLAEELPIEQPLAVNEPPVEEPPVEEPPVEQPLAVELPALPSDSGAIGLEPVSNNEPAPELSLLERLLNILRDPVLLALALGGLLLLVALPVVLIRKKRNKAQKVDEESAFATSAASESADEAEPAAAGSFADRIKARTRRNPLATADELLAKGNFAQADATLRRALAKEPDNTEYLLKLLNIDHTTGDADKFVEDAHKLRAQLQDDNHPDWLTIKQQGRELRPDEPLFGAATEPPTVRVPAAAGLAAAATGAVVATAAASPADEELVFDLPKLDNSAVAVGADDEFNWPTDEPDADITAAFQAMDRQPADEAQDAARLDDDLTFDFDSAGPAASGQTAAADSGLLFDEDDLFGSSAPTPAPAAAAAAPASGLDDLDDSSLFGDLDSHLDTLTPAPAAALDSLSFDEDELFGLPAAGAAATPTLVKMPPAPPAPTPLADDNTLAFDDTDLFSLPDAEESNVTQSVQDDGNTLAFDDNLFDDMPMAEPAAEPAVQRQDDGNTLAFDDNLFDDLPMAESAAEPAVQRQDDGNTLAFDDTDLFDLSAAAEPETAAAPDNLLSFDDTALFASDPQPTGGDGHDLLGAELEHLDFDLSSGDNDVIDFAQSEAMTNDGASGLDLGDESAGGEDFVETKLDLASAYLDMEDQVGARSLLEEVMREGSADQQQRAESLMQRLS